jgi:chromosomal replication initiator protein
MYQGDDFTVQVPSEYFFQYLEGKYATMIHVSLSQVAGNSNVRLLYAITSGEKGIAIIRPSENLSPASAARKTTDGLNKSANTLTPAPEWTSPSLTPSLSFVPPNEKPSPTGAARKTAAGTLNKSANTPPAKWEHYLTPSLSFDNFFEGESNRLAKSVGEAVCKDPGKTFSPLFFHGHSGVGKTHLCHAIGNRMVEYFPEKRIIYVSARQFQFQFTTASRDSLINEFICFYQGVDVLIVDDIHELAGKEKTQNTYVDIFNHLHLLGKQIVLTADKAPAELQGFEERLFSRLKWGATVELLKPDLALRKKILQNKIKQNELQISEEIIDYIAENVTEQIRDLEGIVASLLAHSVTLNREVDMELTKRVVNKAVKIEKKRITIEKILNVVSTYFDIDLKEIHSKSRIQEIVQARQVVMFLSKKHTEYSFSHIGKMVGRKDHATVCHACKTVQNNIDVNKKFKDAMNRMELLLKQ